MSEATPPPNTAVTSLTAKAGDKVDNYTIMEQVGAGATAVVFRGHDHVLNRDVAIKQIVVPQGDAGDDLRQRALAEAQIHKRIASSDPRLLVQYIDTVNDPRGIFMISEYVDGPSLEWILQQETQPMDQRQALGIIAASAKALNALHQGGVVHRDLKPSNILMPREGGLKLADFGLATLIAEQQTLDLGSVRYMSPELLQGESATPQSDLYSLGMVAYEMLAGRENFNSAFRTILRDQRNQAMRWVKWHTNARAKVTPLDQLASGVPASLSQLITRMMEKDPARRVGSCSELLDAIRMHFAQEGQAEQQQAPAPHAAMAPPKIDDVSETAEVPQRSKLPLILAAVLLIWLTVIAGFFVWKEQQKQEALANDTAKLIQAIEAADQLIDQLKFEDAAQAYDAIPNQHANLFDPDNRKGRDDIVESGSLKAQALLAAQRKNFVLAHEKALTYRGIMVSAKNLPSNIKTGLSLRNAKDLVEDYQTRAAFQERCQEIETLFSTGNLDDAIVEIRRLKADTSTGAAQEDLDRIAAFELRHNTLIGDQRVTTLIAKAEKLQADGKLQEAIDALEIEIQDAGEAIDSRITDLAERYNRRLQIQELTAKVDQAEQDGDPSKLLAAMIDLQRVQPTQGMKERINELEIQTLIANAETSLIDGNPERAQTILQMVLERAPNNAQALRMVGTLEKARKKRDAEQQGDQFFAQSEYEQAIAAYQVALSFGLDTDGSINDKIKEARGEINFGASKQALDAGNLAEAQSRLDDARSALGETAAIANLQDKLNELREYTLLVEEGDALFANESYGKAIPKYRAAQKIFDSESIQRKLRDCDFGNWLQQCDGYIARREWDAAIGALNQAERIKTNDQTRARRKQIENRVQ